MYIKWNKNIQLIQKHDDKMAKAPNIDQANRKQLGRRGFYFNHLNNYIKCK